MTPEFIVAQLKNRSFSQLRREFKDVQSADIADLMQSLEDSENVIIMRLLGERSADVFPYLTRERQISLLENLPERYLIRIMNEMEPDDRTRLLEELPENLQQRVILKLSPDERRVARELLSHPEESVGRLMTPDFIAIDERMQVNQALDYIRWRGENLPTEYLSYLFVTDHGGRFQGYVPLGSLVICDPPTLEIKHIMKTDMIPLLATEQETAAVDMFRKYDVPYLPVIDEDRRLIGMVTSDDVFDVAEEDATEDIQQFGGQATLENSYFQTPLLTLLRKRAGWLAVLFIGELFTGTALRHYDSSIAALGFVIYFLPLIISSGGNSGTQAASLIIRGIAVREMETKDWVRVFRREAIMGLGLGTLLGCMGFVRALTWDYSTTVGGVVFLSLIGVVLFGAMVGSMLPFAFKALKLDPAVSSSPFIACLVDLFGILIFINIAIIGTGLVAP